MSSLTDFGACVEASEPWERCEAFRENGERCSYAQESDSKYCPECSRAEALITFDDFHGTAEKIPASGGPRHRVYRRKAVRDLLRDEYGFTPLEAVVLASGSVLSTVMSLEGGLALATIEREDFIPTCAGSLSCHRARELHAQVREQVASDTFIEKWRGACYIVEPWGMRCECQRKTASLCGWHRDRDEADEKSRIDEVSVPYGPDGGENR